MKVNVRSSQLITNVRARRPVERWSTGVNLGVLVKRPIGTNRLNFFLFLLLLACFHVYPVDRARSSDKGYCL